mmetsp:Transcript_23777/g.51934  ORF Transcript_23777/g.51934 Transcript_23777/m.51934 type:complete len:219 (-) Transcript_23777:192-848(-)
MEMKMSFPASRTRFSSWATAAMLLVTSFTASSEAASPFLPNNDYCDCCVELSDCETAYVYCSDDYSWISSSQCCRECWEPAVTFSGECDCCVDSAVCETANLYCSDGFAHFGESRCCKETSGCTTPDPVPTYSEDCACCVDSADCETAYLFCSRGYAEFGESRCCKETLGCSSPISTTRPPIPPLPRRETNAGGEAFSHVVGLSKWCQCLLFLSFVFV